MNRPFHSVPLSCLVLTALLLTAPASQASLLAYYRFDETTGTTAFDSSGNGNHLTWSGSGNAWVPGGGAFGGAIQLGAGGSVFARTGTAFPGTIANLNAATGNQVTISYWARGVRENQGSSLFYINDSNSGTGNRVFQAHTPWTDGRAYWDVSWGDGTNQRVSNPAGLTADRLHNYIMSYDGNTGLMEIYKDNVLLASALQPPQATLPWANIRNFEIGAFSFASYWGGGLVDDFAIFNRLLTPAERGLVFSRGVGSILPEPATVAVFATLVGSAAFFRRRRG